MGIREHSYKGMPFRQICHLSVIEYKDLQFATIKQQCPLQNNGLRIL